MALLAHISPILGRPNFSRLWDLADCLYEALRKIETPDYPDTCHTGYMMPTNYFRLVSANAWNDPPDVGECVILPTTFITESDQKSAMNRWRKLPLCMHGPQNFLRTGNQ
jgi:hypothetical protein